MGSRLRQLRLPIVALGLAVAACAATLVSSAFGSTFPGTNGKLVYVTYSAGADKLYTVNADGSGAHRITKPPANQQGDSQPRFSADGKKIVFTRNPNKAAWYQLQLWIANADGTAAHQITIKGLPSGAFPDSPTFTPDGKSIYFVADTINSPVGIWKVSVDGGTATQVTSGDDYTPTVSPDGKKIAYGHNLTLVIANADGSHPHTLYTEAGTITSIGQPDFSPDGTTIAFMAYNSSTAASDIFTIPAAGGSPTNLTHGTVYSYGDPSYSPDGKKIAYTLFNDATGSYATSIDVMPASGGDATTVVNAPNGGVVYSPDWGVKPKVTHHKHHHHKHHKHKKKK